jgi:RND family efflux transporter MFP subunit
MFRFSRLLLVPVLVIFALQQWSCRQSKLNRGERDEAANLAALSVKAATVKRQDWIVKVPISGSLRTLSTVEIKPEVGGPLIATYAQEGDRVGKGQLLAEIEPVNYRLAYNQAAAALQVAQAGLERAKVSFEHARIERNRADNLLRSGGITEKDHQAAETSVREGESQVRLAEAQCEQARAVLAIAEKSLKDCKIFAPADGHVQKRWFDQGSLLAPGISLYTLVDNSQLELECVIPSYQLAAIRPGQQATFTTPTWGERQFRGVVSAISPTIESDNRSATLKVKTANSGGELRSGMYARGEVIVGREQGVLVIPRDSLIPEKDVPGNSSVYIVREGKTHRVDIEIGDIEMDRVWVRQGLSEGELVIVEIGPALKEGIPVTILTDAADTGK